MIRTRDVLRVKIPYPDIHSGLAEKPHMYICLSEKSRDIYTVKCQTFKHKLLQNPEIKNYKVINPSPLDNPFKVPTLLEYNKIFYFRNGVDFEDFLKMRMGVSESLFFEICEELSVLPRKEIDIINHSKEEIMNIN